MDVEVGRRGGDDDLVAATAGIYASAGCRADGSELRPAGEHDVLGVDATVRRVHADDAAAFRPEPGEGAAFADVDAVGDQCGGVGQHVARCVDVPVAGRVRGTHRDACGHTRVTGVEVGAAQPLDVEPETALQRDAVVGLLRFGFREARHEIALSDEAAVEREAITAGRVELLAEEPELDRGLGAALRADHARGAAAGPVAERRGL